MSFSVGPDGGGDKAGPPPFGGPVQRAQPRWRARK